MGNKAKILVLGCGKIGKLVVSLLARSGDYAVTAADIHLETAQAAIHDGNGKKLPYCEAISIDLNNSSAIDKAMKGQTYVLSCAPYHCNVRIATSAKAAGTHYLDLTEDVATTKAVRELAKDSALAFVPQCGLAPGFITVVANGMAQSFDSIDHIKMRVGALPQYPHNALKYNLTWSTEGLINEYGNPCEAVVNGKLTLLQPLEGLERFNLDGVEYEAFNTSGGLGTLAETFAGKAKSLDYKSVRYPGHREIIALLMNELKMNEDRSTLKKIFENALPTTKQDVVLIMVTVQGLRQGVLSQESYAHKIYHQDIGGEHWGAIQVTTAAGICAVLDLHHDKKIKSKGFIRQEDIPLDMFLSNRFGQYYR
ncbi:MAG: saccharopine dehydrogenase family protein [Betaproteobacteria bacterium]|nr:saccharopine dehydrogenase family protein [Betaproteobacteria bacterium]